MTRADEIVARGDPAEILRMGVGAWLAAEEGRFCECSEPALRGLDLMCGHCLLENLDQRDRRTAAIRGPHAFVPNRNERFRDLMCGLCAHGPDDPRHVSPTERADASGV